MDCSKSSSEDDHSNDECSKGLTNNCTDSTDSSRCSNEDTHEQKICYCKCVVEGSPRFSLRVLEALHYLRGKTPKVHSSSNIEDILNYIKKNYCSDGDLCAQVQTTLKQVCSQGYVMELMNNEYYLIGPSAYWINNNTNISCDDPCSKSKNLDEDTPLNSTRLSENERSLMKRLWQIKSVHSKSRNTRGPMSIESDEERISDDTNPSERLENEISADVTSGLGYLENGEFRDLDLYFQDDEEPERKKNKTKSQSDRSDTYEDLTESTSNCSACNEPKLSCDCVPSLRSNDESDRTQLTTDNTDCEEQHRTLNTHEKELRHWVDNCRRASKRQKRSRSK